MRKLFIAGNWKMNHTVTETREFCRALKAKGLLNHQVDILLCPPYIAIPEMVAQFEDTPLYVGAQNLYQEDNGAYTAEVSAPMLKDAGCSHVLVGHSERRQYFHENDAGVNAKARKALEYGLTPVVCIGETREEREKGVTNEIIKTQLEGALENMSKEMVGKLLIAYEPVWAIGTGLTATPEQAQEVHRYIRECLSRLTDENTAASLRILYGGSAKPANAEALLSETDIDGLLIGGASLKVDDFYGIIDIADDIKK
jgi:triosephosphate isomerase (TIM)